MALEQVRQHVDFAAQTAIFATSPRLASAFQSLWLEPMVENAWKEARGIAIVQGEGIPPPPFATSNGRSRRSLR
jgi:hypothetical protein